VSVQLDGSNSSDAEDQSLDYVWTSNCPNVIFAPSNHTVLPLITFSAASSEGVPVSCSAELTVTNSNERSTTCSAVVTVGSCTRDCAGTINGSKKFDRCGVCDGDGTSCLGCESVNVTKSLFALDGQALAESKLISRVARGLIKNPAASAKAKTLAANSIKAANKYYKEAWGCVWATPQVINNCTNTSFCTQIDNSSGIQCLLSNSAKFGTLLKALNREVQRLGQSHQALSNTRNYRILHNKNVVEAAGIPTVTSACSSAAK